MPRERVYESNVERQAAYRARLTQRQALAGSGQLVARVAELEAALAAMTRRAEAAEERAVRAEAQTADLRDRSNARDGNAAGRPARTPPGPKGRDQVRLFAAMQRIAELEATIDDLQQQLAATPAARVNGTWTEPGGTAGRGNAIGAKDGNDPGGWQLRKRSGRPHRGRGAYPG